ncbi:ankyrin [Thraustotheca clavata]|uniref:Ankyrin n=1 Tax=Thraustotheca clavata TaxID=74557 RepID=A0A1V9Y6V6_9STRA|nr:ankyrin [Thraustotheca clavata]
MWIKYKPEWLTPAPLKLAAICGHLKIVDRLINASINVWTCDAMNFAAMYGYIDVVKYLHNIENGPGCTKAAMDGAATFRHLEVVKFLNENRTEGCTKNAYDGAAHKGNAKVIEYLLNHREDVYTSSYFYFPEFYHIQQYRSLKKRGILVNCVV